MPTNIGLKDILIGARQESHRMRHFYLGTEHLFIALLEIKGSIISNIVKEHGLTPDYVIDSIRRKVGKGSRHRLWAGVPNTPRTEVVLGIANDLALENGREEINERDLLIAMFEEDESMPIRVLKALGLSDVSQLAEATRNYKLNSDSEMPYVKVDFGPDFDRSSDLTKDQLFILRRIFYGYSQIRVDRRLTGGYSNATLLIVTPIQVDSREDSPVVVKINQADVILDEARRYESHVKSKLPAMTARLEDKPIAPETSDLAAIKYTLVAGNDHKPKDMHTIIQEWQDPKRLGTWLRTELFPVFGRIWWQQNRPYRFQAWREYDWLLPPVLTLEMLPDTDKAQAKRNLTLPMKRSKLDGLEYGDTVTVQNFIVQRVDSSRNSLQLAAGQGSEAAKAFKIEVRGVDLKSDTYYRGEVIESMVGRIWKTRTEELNLAVRALEPDFDPREDRITINLGILDKLPNPLKEYEDLLERYVNGTMSTIHGDLHPGNIMMGPNQSAFLIDFAHTREGHTVFDWANLEISLLSDIVMTQAGDSWDDARSVIAQLALINAHATNPGLKTAYTDALTVIQELREIANDCLSARDKWHEYYVALMFCGLRAVTWETMPVASRRLMFLVCALSLHEIKKYQDSGTISGTPSPEETDLNSV